jgi:hypothetical protein
MIENAQKVVDSIISQIMATGYKIPASQQALDFLEFMLNANGFSEAHVNIDSAKTLMPIVVHVEESRKDIFDRVEG